MFIVAVKSLPQSEESQLKKVILLTAVALLILLGTHVVQNYSGAIVENFASFRTSNLHDLISFVHVEPFSIKQGGSHYAVFIITNRMKVDVSYRLEYSHPNFTLSPSGGSLSPGQSENISLMVKEFGSVGSTSLDVYLYADFDGGSACLKTTLSVYVEEGE